MNFTKQQEVFEKEFLKPLGTQQELQVIGPLYSQSKKKIRTELPTLFIDGGVAATSKDFNLSFSLGDQDSASSTASLNVKLPQEKDVSDLEWPLAQLPPSLKKISLIGFSQGDEAHNIINLLVLYRFLQTRQQTYINRDNNGLLLSKGNWNIEIQGRFSVLNLMENIVSIQGQCYYHFGPEQSFPLFSSQGLSNQGHGLVKIKNHAPLILLGEVLQPITH